MDISKMDGESLLAIIKMAEQTERYDDMVKYVKHLADLGGPLTDEQRNLFSVAYKNVIGQRRSSWRIISGIQMNENTDFKPYQVQSCKEKIESELSNLCNEVLVLVSDLIARYIHDDHVESLVFFHKMKGDYYRYIAEFASEEERNAATENSLVSYQKASEISEAKLSPTNPICLGLALNFSVFYYEILNDRKNACDLAKFAFDNAINVLDSVKEDSYKDSTLIMQLLRDNLTLWTGEDDEEQYPE